jgi:hypothetical protein
VWFGVRGWAAAPLLQAGITGSSRANGRSVQGCERDLIPNDIGRAACNW